MLVWAIGYSGARRAERQDEASRASRRQAVTDERARMARELHDLVGHTVNLMLVQAGAARRVLDRDEAKARELLEILELTGREALDDGRGRPRATCPAGGCRGSPTAARPST